MLPAFSSDSDIYDVYVNESSRDFKPWTELVTKYNYRKDEPFFNILVPTSDTVKYKYIAKKLVTNGYNLLVSGETGVGKSVIIQGFLNSLDQEKYMSVSINFSA